MELRLSLIAGWLVFLLSCSSSVASRTVFLTPPTSRTAVGTAISGVHKLLRSGWGPHLPDIVVLAMVDGLFGLYGSERWDELLIGI